MIGINSLLINRSNIVTILMSLELILLSINLIFLIISAQSDDVMGNLISIFILTVAAAETSIGLAILLRFYRIKGTISTEFITSLKG
jgi:NADH-quinone oxidoreductase subunit K